MSVYEALMGVGSWELTLSENCPQYIRQRITPFTSVLILPAHTPKQGDATMLSAARYHGIVRKPGQAGYTIGGGGLALLWGDEDGKGRIETTTGTIGAGSLDNFVERYQAPWLSRSVTDPTGATVVFSSDKFYGLDYRTIMGVVCQFYVVEWRISTAMALTVAPSGTLFNPARKALAVRKGLDGFDPSYWGIASDIKFDQDYDDYANVTAVRTATGLSAWKAHSSGNIFRDPMGNLLDLRRVVDGSNVPDGARDAVAQFQANIWGSPGGQRTVHVSSAQYDIRGRVTPGDPMLVFDPSRGLVDTATSVPFRGRRVYPATVRCMGLRWNLAEGMGVWHRVHDGTNVSYTDLTPWVQWEGAGAELEVGALKRTPQMGWSATTPFGP